MAGPRKFILGIDVGAGSIKPELVEVLTGGLAEKVTVIPPATTRKKGIADHADQLAEVIIAGAEKARELGGELAGIGIASPGRFNKHERIMPGSSPMMGQTPQEFDNVNLHDEYTDALRRAGQKASPLLKLPLLVANDGNAMLAGMIDAIRQGRAGELTDQRGYPVDMDSLRKRNVAVFGLGSGLGHSIVSVDKDGDFSFVTDGHASKLRVKVDAGEDWEMIQQAAQLLNEPGKDPNVVIFPEDHTVRAEDLMRSPVINALAGVPGEQIDPANERHRKALAFAGKYVARLIALIASGESEDVKPANRWSPQDRYEASKTTVYLLGGKLGNSANGAEIIKYARQEMDKIPEIEGHRLVQMAENDAPRGAAAMVYPLIGRSPAASR